MSQVYGKGRRRETGKGYTGGSVVLILMCCALAVFLLSTSYWGDRLVDKYITPAFAKMLGRVLITRTIQRGGHGPGAGRNALKRGVF